MTARTGRGGAGSGRRRAAAPLAALVAFAACSVLPVSLPPSALGQEPGLLVLSPAENEEPGGDLLIAISFVDPEKRIDPRTVRLLVDGRDVSAAATINKSVVTYVPDPPLRPGKHRFELRMRDNTGRELRELRREFGVAGKVETEPSAGVSGRLTLETLLDDLSGPGTSLRQEPGHTHTGRLTLKGLTGGWKYRATMFLTSDEDEEFQPRNRYSFHLDRDRIGVDVGDVNYDFSPFTLLGKRTRGLGGTVDVGGVRIRALLGHVRRAIPGKLDVRDSTYVLPGGETVLIPDTTVVGSTFERGLIGARLEFEPGRAFRFGIDGVRVRDDVASLDEGLNPKDNLVLGANAIFTPLRRQLVLDAAAGVSFLTDDISGGSIRKQDLEDLLGEHAGFPFEPKDVEDLLILNLSTRPLDPTDGSNLAFEGGIKGNMFGHLFESRFRQVGPTFVSLAAPSIQSDKRSLRFKDTFRMIRDRLQVAGEFERFTDNLQDDKRFTTATKVFGFTGALNTGRVDIKNITFGYRIYHRSNGAPAPDSAGAFDPRIDDRTTTVQLGTGYHFRLAQSHDISLSYLRAETNGEFDGSTDATQTDWKLGWQTRFEMLPLQANVGYGINNTEYSLHHVKYTTWDLGGRYSLMDSRMEAFANLSRVSGDSDAGLFDADKSRVEGGARYRLAARRYLSGRLARVSCTNDGNPDNEYHETVLNLRLVQEF